MYRFNRENMQNERRAKSKNDVKFPKIKDHLYYTHCLLLFSVFLRFGNSKIMKIPRKILCIECVCGATMERTSNELLWIGAVWGVFKIIAGINAMVCLERFRFQTCIDPYTRSHLHRFPQSLAQKFNDPCNACISLSNRIFKLAGSLAWTNHIRCLKPPIKPKTINAENLSFWM